MIHGIYIIKSSGICVFHKELDGIDEDPQEVSALLTAISLFSRKTFGEHLKAIMTTNRKLMLYKEGDLYFVYVVDLEESLKYLANINDIVRLEFFQHLSNEQHSQLETENLIPFLPQFEQNITELITNV